jgi:hypothetical protein
MIAQGRFSRKAAIEGINYLLKGFDEGSDEVAEAIITMIA